MKISEIKSISQDLYELARLRQMQYKYSNDEYKGEDADLVPAFVWSDTHEGSLFWANLDNGYIESALSEYNRLYPNHEWRKELENKTETEVKPTEITPSVIGVVISFEDWKEYQQLKSERAINQN